MIQVAAVAILKTFPGTLVFKQREAEVAGRFAGAHFASSDLEHRLVVRLGDNRESEGIYILIGRQGFRATDAARRTPAAKGALIDNQVDRFDRRDAGYRDLIKCRAIMRQGH